MHHGENILTLANTADFTGAVTEHTRATVRQPVSLPRTHEPGLPVPLRVHQLLAAAGGSDSAWWTGRLIGAVSNVHPFKQEAVLLLSDGSRLQCELSLQASGHDTKKTNVNYWPAESKNEKDLPEYALTSRTLMENDSALNMLPSSR